MVGACSSVGTLVIAPSTQFLLARWDWHVGAVFFLILAVAMLPAAYLAGGVDRMPRPRVEKRATMREVVGQALRSRRYRGHERRLFRLRPATDLPDHASAQLSRDLRTGSDVERDRAGDHRRGEHLRLLVRRLARRPVPEIHSAWIAVPVTILRAGDLYFMIPPTPTSTIVFAAAMGMLWLGVIPLVSGYVAELFGTRYMATILGMSFVVHQMGSVIGAWGWRTDLRRVRVLRFGVAHRRGRRRDGGHVAQILFGGPELNPRRGMRTALAAG